AYQRFQNLKSKPGRTAFGRKPTRDVPRPKTATNATPMGAGQFQIDGNDYQTGKVLAQAPFGQAPLLKPSTKAQPERVRKSLSANPPDTEGTDNAGTSMQTEARLYQVLGERKNVAKLGGTTTVSGQPALILEHIGGGTINKTYDDLKRMSEQGKMSS